MKAALLRSHPAPAIAVAAAVVVVLQARGFAKARSSGSLDAYTIAVSKAIADEGDEDVVQVGGFAGSALSPLKAQFCSETLLSPLLSRLCRFRVGLQVSSRVATTPLLTCCPTQSCPGLLHAVLGLSQGTFQMCPQ